MACRLVKVVGVHELVAIDAIWGVAFHVLHIWLAAIKRDDLGDVSRDQWTGKSGSRTSSMNACLAGLNLMLFAGLGLSLFTGNTRDIREFRVCASLDVFVRRQYRLLLYVV